MPTGGFKILDTAEVKMAFSAYTQYLTNSPMHNISISEARSAAATANGGQGWFSKTFSSSGSRCPALVQNEARPSDRTQFNRNFITAVQLVGPTQIVPATFMNAPPPRTAPSSRQQQQQQPHERSKSDNTSPTDAAASGKNADESAAAAPPKFDPDLIAASRTHRIVREASAVAECSAVNPPASDSPTARGGPSVSSHSPPPPPTARLRDCETLVLWDPASVTLALYNNVATLFAFIDPASPDPVANAEHQKRIEDGDRFIPLQTIKFSTRCTAFTTFTTHVDYLASHGLCAVGVDTGKAVSSFTSASSSSSKSPSATPSSPHVPRGPFSPCELWSVFGFGSGDICVWSHAQETMLKRHNNTSTLSRDADKISKDNSSGASATTRLCFVEPGVAVSAISRVERGHTEKPMCMQWAKAAAEQQSSSQSTPYDQKLSRSGSSSGSMSSALGSGSTAAAAAALHSRFNTQTQPFCDVVVGYENGTILVLSLNATGGFINHKLSGWFGFSAVRSIKPCPVAPSLLAVGCDNGALRLMQFPWSFDVAYFEARFQNASESDLSVADIGTAKDPRVLCSVGGAVSGGGVTTVNWSCNGEAVVATGEDDAVSMVSIDCSPSLEAFQEQQVGGNTSPAATFTGQRPASSPMKRESNHAKEPITITPLAVHRRNFNQSWLACNMILSLDVINYPGAAGSVDDDATKAAELRKVTGVYVASLDGGVVAGAAFPASELKGPRRTPAGGSHTTGAVIHRHDSIASAVAAAQQQQHQSGSSSNNNGQDEPSSRPPDGLGIRNRPLARFLQMARADMVIGFAPLGEYHAEGCKCCFDTCPMSTRTAVDGTVEHAPQRKRAFVTVTAKGTLALWTFYDILLEEEEEEEEDAKK